MMMSEDRNTKCISQMTLLSYIGWNKLGTYTSLTINTIRVVKF